MPLTPPTKSPVLPLSSVTPAFLRAMIALGDYQAGGRTPAQLERAAWAQRFFYVQGLNPRLNENVTAALDQGLRGILALRRAVQQDGVVSVQNNTPNQFPDVQSIVARLQVSPLSDAVAFLKRTFGTRGANGVTPIPLRINLGAMRSNGTTQLERCTTLTQANNVLQQELLNADNNEAAAGRPRRYAKALKPVADADFDDYDAAWNSLELDRPSVIYESLSPSMLAPPGDAPIYGQLPPEFAPGADQNNPFEPFAP